MNEKSRILLVVDDESDARDLFRDLFTRKGYDVQCASSGMDALDIVDRNDIDIILLDIKMPGMDGIETLSKLKQKKPDLLVIMLTAYGYDDNLIDKTLQLGASGYISKSLPLSQIFNTFWTILSTVRKKTM